MPPSEPFAPVELLLEAARQRVAETTLRDTAAEIGMEHSGLNKLLKGAKPRLSTIRKLTVWYVERVASGELEVTPEAVHAALAILTRHLPPLRRAAIQAQVVEQLKSITSAEGVPAPRWMKAR